MSRTTFPRSLNACFPQTVEYATAIEGYKRPPSWLWVAVYVAAAVVLAVVL